MARVAEPGRRGDGEDDRYVEVATSARRFAGPNIQQRLQVSAFAYAYRKIHGRGPAILVANMVTTENPVLDIEYTERSLDEDTSFVHLAANIARGINAGAFPPVRTPSCADCEYGIACSEWRDERLLRASSRRHLSLVTDTDSHAP